MQPSPDWSRMEAFPCDCQGGGTVTLWSNFLRTLMECEQCGATFYPSGEGMQIQLAVTP